MSNNLESKDMEKNDKVKVDLDTILVEEIGQFGKYQAKILALCATMVIFASWSATEFIFTTARINTRCVIPECDTPNPAFAPWWIDKAVPSTSTGALNDCQRYAVNTSVIVADGTCPSELFDTNVIVDCEDYVYENTNTVVYDFGLACDEWRRSLIGSIRIFGALVAFLVTGYTSDNWGRRTAYIITTFNTFWIGVTRYWADTYIGFVISEFVEAIFGSGAFTISYVVLMEIVGRKYRVACGATMSSFFAIGQMTTGAIAWAVPYWKNLTLALYIPQALVLINIWLATESVRWLMCKDRFTESEALLNKMAKTNGRTLQPKSLELLRQTIEEENKRKKLQKQQKAELLVVQVFRHKSVLYRMVVTPVCWITLTLIYYGLSINAVNLTGNSYLNYIAVSAIEIPGFWTAVLLINKVGRKPVLSAAYWICSACQVAYIFTPNDLFGASLAVYLVGKFSIAMVVSTIYIYTAELYPTKHRQTLFNFSSMIGRIGSIVAPLTPAIGTATFYEMPFVIFAVLAFISGLLILTLPETLGAKLPDTLEESDKIGKKESRNT